MPASRNCSPTTRASWPGAGVAARRARCGCGRTSCTSSTCCPSSFRKAGWSTGSPADSSPTDTRPAPPRPVDTCGRDRPRRHSFGLAPSHHQKVRTGVVVFPPLSERFVIDGRVALVTGAAHGIGLAVARRLHARGASVALVDVDTDEVRAAAAQVGDHTLAVTADVRDRPALREAVAQTVDRFGRLDIVVANAGVSPTPGTLRVMDDAEFDRVLGVNLTGVYNTVRAGLDQIVANRGHVVVVSSAAAFAPGAGGAPYMISKAGVEQLGRALRVELAPHGASAQVAYFGLVKTAMFHAVLEADELGRQMDGMLPWPLNRRIEPDEAARSLVDGIATRAATSIAPAGWRQYSHLRGLVNPVIDRRLRGDGHLHQLIRTLERRFE
ncbi:SDR family NAD(P)-dependent oxidoreductase [Nocardia farcinica]|nr:SDR family NAD(P)-dependent oxidoreductase [Nocardia farcinica]